MLVDITERKLAQAALTEIEARFHSVAMNAPAAVYIKDRAGRYVVANRVACEALGRPDGAAGFTDHDLLTPEAADRLREHDQGVLSTGRALELDETVTRDGFERRYLSVKFPVQDRESNVYGIGGVSIDITERKRIESALHEAIAEQRRADDRKDEFLATLAHELRNPLAPILYGLEIVKASRSGSESEQGVPGGLGRRARDRSDHRTASRCPARRRHRSAQRRPGQGQPVHDSIAAGRVRCSAGGCRRFGRPDAAAGEGCDAGTHRRR